MDIQKNELEQAAKQVGISDDKIDELWTNLSKKPKSSSNNFILENVLYYTGALITLAALTFFMGVGWETFGGGGMMIIALAYAFGFFLTGHYFWKNNNFVLGGLLVCLGVGMMPLATYGFQEYTGWWIVSDPGQYRNFYEWIRGGWFLMEVVTIVVGLIALYFYRFPFLSFIIFFTLWFMSMDIIPIIFKGDEDALFYKKEWTTLVFGLIILTIAFIVDQRTKRDFAFWGYLFGSFTFWGALCSLVFFEDTGEFAKVIYLLISLFFMFLAILLQRIILMVFGVLGLITYLSHLAYDIFEDSLIFTFALSFIGLFVAFLGVVYSKNQARIEEFVFRIIPDSIKNNLPHSR